MGFIGTLFGFGSICLFVYCFKKIKNRKEAIYRIASIGGGAVLVLIVSLIIVNNGTTTEDKEGGWVLIFFYGLCFSWRIVLDIIFILRDKEFLEIKTIKEYIDDETQQRFEIGSTRIVEISRANVICLKGYAVPLEKEMISSTNIESLKEEVALCSKCNFQLFPEDKICPQCMHDVSNETKPLKIDAPTIQRTTQPLIKRKQSDKQPLSKKDKLLELKSIFDEGLITEQDYEVARRKILEIE